MEQEFSSPLLENAVAAMAQLPGIGRKTALRLVLHLLRQPEADAVALGDALTRLRREVRYCQVCHNISDRNVCPICDSPLRDHSTVCVVENVKDVMNVENTHQHHGVYHVLGGIISPIGGVGPSDLTIKELVARVAELENPSSAELILALSGDVEGETTAFYIYRQVEASGIKVSSLARGLGFGDDLEYADTLTLGRSIVNRQEFKP